MTVDHPHARRRRANGAFAVLLTCLGILVVAFFRVQVVRSSTWRLQAEDNRLRPYAVPAARGTIFDRNGRVLADNVPGYAVSLLAAERDSIESRLRRLQPILGLSDERVGRLLETRQRAPRQPLEVEGDAPFDVVSKLEELRHYIPGLFIEMRPKRRYPAGPAVSHVLGYISQISAEELELPRFEGYEQGAIIGKAGIEREYEPILHGEPGVRYVEVDAAGRVVGSFSGVANEPGRPGGDIRLTLDRELMEYIHRIFPDTLNGAVVALDPADGGVLALYSAPSYDPNAFVGGIDPELFEAWTTDSRLPLFNRAVLGRAPPASTWKLATAAIGLELGVVTPGEYMPQPCTGSFRYGNTTRHCWDRDGHGYLDLAGAVQHSCDVYFYQLGLRIGLRRYVDEVNRLGFPERCGIDLPQEMPGGFPDDLTYWERTFGYRPNEIEVLFLSIGQGPNETTPLKIAQFYVALARDGTAPPPRLFLGEEGAEEWDLEISGESLTPLREGLRRTVQELGGTAYRSKLELWDLIGKTGTAENPPDPDHGWFAGIAGPKGGDPEIVIVVFQEFGLHGSWAAPVAAKAADFYLRRKYGIPVDTVQTLGEHIDRGLPVPWGTP